MTATTIVLIAGFAYSLYSSFLAYRESGKIWMLFFPGWIERKSGISSTLRLHGKIAFAILFAGIVMLKTGI